jgi:XRE family transcriptional regulator, regulator of sulfur utilization
MKELCHQFGKIVRNFREQNGWSQELLADRAGLNRSYLGEIERGTVVPSLATISKISKAFQKPMTALIELCE